MPGYPPDLKARGLAGVVMVRYVVDAHGGIVPDSNRIMSTSDSGFVDSAWAAIRSCHYVPRIVDGNAVATTMFEQIVFALPQRTDFQYITDMDMNFPELDSISVEHDKDRRARVMRSYLSLTTTYGLGAETICIFLAIAFGASRLMWRRPILVAFGVTTVLVAIFVGLLLLAIYETTAAPGMVRVAIVSLIMAALNVGPVAWAFKALAPASLRMRIAVSALVAVLATPFAILFSLFAACIVGIGCI